MVVKASFRSLQQNKKSQTEIGTTVAMSKNYYILFQNQSAVFIVIKHRGVAPLYCVTVDCCRQ